MKRVKSINVYSQSSIRRIVLGASIVLLLMTTACTSSYNSSKNWNRTPASTGRNRCGCLLNPIQHHAIKLYQQPTYALQA